MKGEARNQPELGPEIDEPDALRFFLLDGGVALRSDDALLRRGDQFGMSGPRHLGQRDQILFLKSNVDARTSCQSKV